MQPSAPRVSQASQSGPGLSLLARYEALSRVSRAICAYRDPAKLFHVLADELRHAVNFDFVAVFLYDQASHKIRNLVLETVKGPGFAIPADFPAEEPITWWVYHHQAPMVIPSRDHEPRFPLMMEVFRSYG